MVTVIVVNVAALLLEGKAAEAKNLVCRRVRQEWKSRRRKTRPHERIDCLPVGLSNQRFIFSILRLMVIVLVHYKLNFN